LTHFRAFLSEFSYPETKAFVLEAKASYLGTKVFVLEAKASYPETKAFVLEAKAFYLGTKASYLEKEHSIHFKERSILKVNSNGNSGHFFTQQPQQALRRGGRRQAKIIWSSLPKETSGKTQRNWLE